ncbi:hypothetical protein HDF19_04430 [Mucilaginibacter sp. E4BP6]|uniref:hypothetical protein n=1 Tax=Mucilaginibacter sp. E4BP6 TaxID=2723089 RepID=UPI0015CD7409|nr:hypothetical protein [Mucilaginibacter sp. E4BP6]NYE64721.1 hypothetical protein [Mucilaginibacter sp. E4BP6]
MKKLIFLAFLFFSLSAYSQICPLSDFTKLPPPQSDSKDWRKLNLEAYQRFSVSIVNGKVQVSKVESSSTDTTSYNLKRGQLFSYDAGEFGGNLYFLPKDTSQTIYVDGEKAPLVKKIFAIGIRKELIKKLADTPHILITGGNINAIFSYKDSLFFMTGIAHMGTNRGSIYKLELEGDNFKISKKLDFDNAPMSVAVYKKRLFVATYNRFYIINRWKKQLILDSLFWYGFYPNSIAVYNSHTVYAGMNGGYVKVDIKKKQLIFFKYKDY